MLLLFSTDDLHTEVIQEIIETGLGMMIVTADEVSTNQRPIVI